MTQRSTSGPSVTGTKPAAVAAAISSGVKSPSGPTSQTAFRGGDGTIRDWIENMAYGSVSTPRGGLHWYIPCGNVTQGTHFLPNVDARAAGGYVLLPPSLVNGRRYAGTVPTPGAAA